MKDRIIESSGGIRSISDIKKYREFLEDQAEIKEQKIQKRFRKFQKKTDASKIYGDVLEKFEWDNSILLTLLPHFLKTAHNVKNRSGFLKHNGAYLYSIFGGLFAMLIRRYIRNNRDK